MSSSPSHPREPRNDPATTRIVPEYATRSSPLGGLLVPAVVLVSAAGILVALYAINARDRAVPSVVQSPASSGAPLVSIEPAPDAPARHPRDVAAERRREVLEIYFGQVVPQLDRSLVRKRAAAERAIAGLRERIEARRSGVEHFAHDVTTWGTRFGVVGRMSRDSWRRWRDNGRDTTATKRYIENKFRAHVLSERDLHGALEAAVQQFGADLEADRNALFADIRLPLQTSGVQIRIEEDRWEPMQREMMARAGALAEAGAKDNLVSGLTAVTVSGVAGWAAERVVVQILARVGPMVAAQLATSTATAGGGAMAGGAGGGGAVGSLGGPAGTVVGVGVGLVIGAAIDWWMTDRFKDKLAEQCNRFIDALRDQLIDGTPQQPGLRIVFDDAVRLADEAQRKAILEVLLEEIGSSPMNEVQQMPERQNTNRHECTRIQILLLVFIREDSCPFVSIRVLPFGSAQPRGAHEEA